MSEATNSSYFETFDEQEDLDRYLLIEGVMNSWVLRFFPDVGPDLIEIAMIHVEVKLPCWIAAKRGES